ncbi:hypothetical protein [Streptomyces sp. KL118A]|uniref:hypothetical protein n=1 Tax=Streptomyces sp. KL118A TaxID=3045153 RepID=UPI00278C2AC3|nr:hypothetical protein [Streptomyces sp. KL118A]
MRSARPEGENRSRRTRHPVALAIGIGCCVLAVVVGTYLLGSFDSLRMVPVWIGFGAMLIVPLRKLGARESSVGAALFIAVAALFAGYGADLARDDVTLQVRGEKVVATVAEERQEGVGKSRRSYYVLEGRDGTRVPGPEMATGFEAYEVGQALTVLVDPEGELEPRTPGEADATGELLSSGGALFAALGCVAWMTWRGSVAARRGEDAWTSSAQDEQEQKLREALRRSPTDRRGYIKVPPEDYPAISHRRAARIAWEMGLRAEATGNRGAWRFGESVVVEVPLD